jgi:hypothetical protein
MLRSTTIVAIAAVALALACERRQGEDSAADQLEQRTEAEGEPGAPSAQPKMTEREPSAAAERGRAGELRVSDVTAEPEQHMTGTVTVVGEVKDMLGSRAFKLSDEAPSMPGQDNDIVVLGKENAAWTMDETKGDARLRVKGRLERIPNARLTKELGWEPGDKVQDEMKGEKVVLIAESVERMEGEEREPVRGAEEQPHR